MADNMITLSNGQRMPNLGLGTWQSPLDVMENAVTWALETGYRHIDTAYMYGNEEAIGKAVNKWIANGGNREELFITTKLPYYGNRASDVSKYLNESLERLGLDYVDLYLIHHPFGFLEPTTGTSPKIDFETDHLAIWKEMEKAVTSERARSIGLSNFNAQQIEKIVTNATIPPVILQVELHVYLQQPDLREACKRLGLSLTAYSPLGSPAIKVHYQKKYNYQGDVPCPIIDPEVVQIAKERGVTPAQVLLSFLIQLGIAVIPKSSSKERIQENFDALNFTLDKDDMNTLKSLDRGENGRIFDFLLHTGLEEHPEYPFPKKTKAS